MWPVAPFLVSAFALTPPVCIVLKNRVVEEPDRTDDGIARRASLDERFVAQLLPESPLDRVESQELRQLVMHALQGLTPDELKVVEQRFQRKQSVGQVASRLKMARSRVSALEATALDKLRGPLTEYMES